MTDPDAQAPLAPPPPPPSVPSKAVPDLPDLIWEDEPQGSHAWWLSRARSVDHQVFIAADPLTRCLLCLGHDVGKSGRYDVLAVLREADYSDHAACLSAMKHVAAVKLSNPAAEAGRSVAAWRLHRAAKLALNQTPWAAAALLIGALLGLGVALFAISTSMVGWPMLAAGILIGAASGPLLKFLVDRRFKSLLGPWGRFWVATLAAAVGAFTTAGGLLTLFWT